MKKAPRPAKQQRTGFRCRGIDKLARRAQNANDYWTFSRLQLSAENLRGSEYLYYVKMRGFYKRKRLRHAPVPNHA